MVLKSRVKAPDWSAGENPDREAKCRKHPLPTHHNVSPETDPFFYDEEEARHICNGTYDGKVCPFRDACLYGALLNNEGSGVFGGLTVAQRKWVRKQRYNTLDLITSDDWHYPEDWLHTVPSPSDLIEEEGDDDDESDEEE